MSLEKHCMKDVKHNQISLLFFIFKKIKSSSINLHMKVVAFSGSLSRVHIMVRSGGMCTLGSPEGDINNRYSLFVECSDTE